MPLRVYSLEKHPRAREAREGVSSVKYRGKSLKIKDLRAIRK